MTDFIVLTKAEAEALRWRSADNFAAVEPITLKDGSYFINAAALGIAKLPDDRKAVCAGKARVPLADIEHLRVVLELAEAPPDRLNPDKE